MTNRQTALIKLLKLYCPLTDLSLWEYEKEDAEEAIGLMNWDKLVEYCTDQTMMKT